VWVVLGSSGAAANFCTERGTPLTRTAQSAEYKQVTVLGPNPSVVELAQTITERASGTPFFAEDIVRELADRGVSQENPGSYVSTAEAADVSVPATLQATIAARIDRLGALATSLSFEGHMEWAEAMS